MMVNEMLPRLGEREDDDDDDNDSIWLLLLLLLLLILIRGLFAGEQLSA